VWVVAGLLIARALGAASFMPDGYAVGTATLAGGALLGFGAYVNRACVFGAIARLGSGEWAYAVTPVGFFAGCATVGLFPIARPDPALHMSLTLQAPSLIAALAVAFIAIRSACTLIVARRLRAQRGTSGETSAWSPHTATTVIGIAFVVILLISGAWAYTDVLAELARGMAGNLLARSLLVFGLLAGAMLGGYAAGRWRNTPPSFPQCAKCLGGGVLMAWGSLLIPGGNDGLILVGMPLLWPYAWVAFLAMCASIVAALLAHGAWMRLR